MTMITGSAPDTRCWLIDLGMGTVQTMPTPVTDTAEMKAPPKKSSVERNGYIAGRLMPRGTKQTERMSDQQTCLSGYLTRIAPDIFAKSTRTSRSANIRRLWRPASDHLRRKPKSPILWRLPTFAKTGLYDRETVSGKRRQKKNADIEPLCDACPAGWGPASVDDSCRVARHPRAHKDANGCGSKHGPPSGRRRRPNRNV